LKGYPPEEEENVLRWRKVEGKGKVERNM